MGVELLFVVSALIWLGIFFYLLVLHLQQRKLARAVERLREMPERTDEKLEP